MSGPTVCVTGAGAGVDSAWEQEKPEARKMPHVAKRQSLESSARFMPLSIFTNGGLYCYASFQTRYCFSWNQDYMSVETQISYPAVPWKNMIGMLSCFDSWVFWDRPGRCLVCDYIWFAYSEAKYRVCFAYL